MKMTTRQQTPRLSVIVANYNNAPYIAACLESALAQTWRDLEIVVYDDASSDASPAIVERFARERPGLVRLIRGRVNRGVAQARHQAILAARGEYLTTLDGDDYYGNRRKLENEVTLARRCAEQEGREVLAFSNVLLERENAPPVLWGKPETIAQGMIGSRLLARNCFIPRDFVFSRAAYFRLGGYDALLPIYEDWDLKIRLAFVSPFCYTGEAGSVYRLHGRGLSARPWNEHVLTLRLIFAKNISLAQPEERETIRAEFVRWLESNGARTPLA